MKHVINLTDEQIAVINAALQELPMKIAYPIVSDIFGQIEAAKAEEAAMMEKLMAEEKDTEDGTDASS